MRIRTFARLVLLTLCTGLLAACSNSENPPKTTTADTTATPVDSTTNRDSVTIELTGVDSVSVFDLLRQSHQVDFISTSGGVFVKGIDSVQNGPATFWIYTVNDTTPKVAADRMLTQAGDRVVWRFRKMKS